MSGIKLDHLGYGQDTSGRFNNLINWWLAIIGGLQIHNLIVFGVINEQH